MKSRPWKNSEGYKFLAVYKNTEIIQDLVLKITAKFPPESRRLRDHMNDSARSEKQNIAEGFRRETTEEYLKFLGFAQGSLAELDEDTDDCYKKFHLIDEKTYEELHGWLKKTDYLFNRLIASLERKIDQRKVNLARDWQRKYWE